MIFPTQRARQSQMNWSSNMAYLHTLTSWYMKSRYSISGSVNLGLQNYTSNIILLLSQADNINHSYELKERVTPELGNHKWRLQRREEQAEETTITMCHRDLLIPAIFMIQRNKPTISMQVFLQSSSNHYSDSCESSSAEKTCCCCWCCNCPLPAEPAAPMTCPICE